MYAKERQRQISSAKMAAKIARMKRSVGPQTTSFIIESMLNVFSMYFSVPKELLVPGHKSLSYDQMKDSLKWYELNRKLWASIGR